MRPKNLGWPLNEAGSQVLEINANFFYKMPSNIQGFMDYWNIEIRLGWLGPQMKANLSEYCRQEYLPIEFKEFYCRDILFFPEGYI